MRWTIPLQCHSPVLPHQAQQSCHTKIKPRMIIKNNSTTHRNECTMNLLPPKSIASFADPLAASSRPSTWQPMSTCQLIHSHAMPPGLAWSQTVPDLLTHNHSTPRRAQRLLGKCWSALGALELKWKLNSHWQSHVHVCVDSPQQPYVAISVRHRILPLRPVCACEQHDSPSGQGWAHPCEQHKKSSLHKERQ